MSERKVRATVKREREVRTFAELAHASWVILENAKQQRSGWMYECMASILMTAFAFEAYLNHIGELGLACWNKTERMSYKKKLDLVRNKLHIEERDGERPFATLVELFQFRNDIAHGRSEHLDPDASVESGTMEDLRHNHPLTDWEQKCTLEFAEQCHDDIRKIMEEIHAKAGYDVVDLAKTGSGYSILNVQEER